MIGSLDVPWGYDRVFDRCMSLDREFLFVKQSSQLLCLHTYEVEVWIANITGCKNTNNKPTNLAFSYAIVGVWSHVTVVTRCRSPPGSVCGGSAGSVGGAIGSFHGNVDVVEGDVSRETS